MTDPGVVLSDKLQWIRESMFFFVPELVLTVGILIILIVGLTYRFRKKPESTVVLYTLAIICLGSSLVYSILNWDGYKNPVSIFNWMIRSDDFSWYLKLLFDIGGLLTVLMAFQKNSIAKYHSEFISLLFAVILGAHLLVMSTNLVMVFLSLELISISSYVLSGFSFHKEGAEGSLKYFLFGSVASAVMLYGFSFFYGLTGTLEFSSNQFQQGILNHQSYLLLLAGIFSLAGFLFKIAATPMHLWAPDVYEASPMPVVALFSVVPKLAGFGVLLKFVLALSVFGQSSFSWQFILGLISIITICVGNFAALKQKNPKRLMAYSSIAQSGFLLVGIVTFQKQGMHMMLYYASVFLIANFLVFAYLQFFEAHGVKSIDDFSGVGKKWPSQQIILLVGFISLTGLPPTAGFMAKLFIFSSLWESYQYTGKTFLLWLLVIGLLNTVVSLFYYLKIPTLAFLKPGAAESAKYLTWQNFFGLVMVLALLFLFLLPDLLMGWINKINFVL
ncbi:MAG TPA: NADH-quinone oxidoreductase subunit N [Cyclobacteriaceae bacterium]|nr:NADH-quinone oxidoreductase subunit N [Cyclobacteriaceae bacterium]